MGAQAPDFQKENNMNELEQKILDVIGTRNLTMREIADELDMSVADIWHGGLNRLIGTGDVEKMTSNSMTIYRRSRVTRDITNNHSLSDSQGTVTQSIPSREKDKGKVMVRRVTCAGARPEIPPYPEDPEEVVTAAGEIGYVMSLREAAKFISIYAPFDWESVEGRKIRNWPKLLHVWKSRQKPDEYIQAVNEAKRRAAGLPPVDPAELEYEYYEDAQGRKWRKRPDETEWEEVKEYITFSDGTTALKGVV